MLFRVIIELTDKPTTYNITKRAASHAKAEVAALQSINSDYTQVNRIVSVPMQEEKENGNQAHKEVSNSRQSRR